MDGPAREFLSRLLHTPSPSGFEEAIQAEVRAYVAPFAHEVSTDLHGNVMASLNRGATPRLMVAGHCDQIGMLVSHIDDQGFVYAQTIGGWDPQQLVGQSMTLWTRTGPVPAVISRKPIHLLTPEEQKKVVDPNDMWLDLGAANKQEAQSVVRIGDPVTLRLGWQELRNRLICGPGLDDKCGLWVTMESLRIAHQLGVVCGFFAVSTVQEEIGLRGARTSAYGVDPTVGIAVDVTHATDCPTIDRKQHGEIALGKGPVIFRGPNANPRVVERLLEVAAEREIPVQLAAIGRATSNDANNIQVSRSGVATAVVAIPNRYMHSAVETVSLDDITGAAELIARFAATLTPECNFTPGSPALR